jgi:mRNA interferase MazF
VVLLPGGAGGLPKASFAVCHQITTLDRAKLTEPIGTLPAGLLREVEEGLKAALDLE